MSYTLVYSCKPGFDATFPNIRIGEPSARTKLFHTILREKCPVTFKNNKYYYSPSKEYENYVIRFRGVK